MQPKCVNSTQEGTQQFIVFKHRKQYLLMLKKQFRQLQLESKHVICDYSVTNNNNDLQLNSKKMNQNGQILIVF